MDKDSVGVGVKQSTWTLFCYCHVQSNTNASGDNTTVPFQVDTPLFTLQQSWIYSERDVKGKVKELAISDVTLNVRKQRKFRGKFDRHVLFPSLCIIIVWSSACNWLVYRFELDSFCSNRLFWEKLFGGCIFFNVFICDKWPFVVCLVHCRIWT